MVYCLEHENVYGTIVRDAPGWTGSARSNLVFGGDAFFGCEVPIASIGVVAGFNSLQVSAHYSDIDHGLWFRRGILNVIENGVVVPLGLIYEEGTRFYVVRMGTTVVYCRRAAGLEKDDYYLDPNYPGVYLPGAIIYVSEIGSFDTVFVDTSFYNTGDRLTCEFMGQVWYPGIEDQELAEQPNSINGTLPFIGKVADIESWTYAELPFEVEAGENFKVRIDADLRFTGLLADIELNTLIVGDLPFTVSVDANPAPIYETVSGISGALEFSLEASTLAPSAVVEGELPFVALGTMSEAAFELSSGIISELPFTAFGTGTDAVDTPATAGVFVDLPFSAFGTTTAAGETAATAGMSVELPFTGFATTDNVEIEAAEAGIYGEMPFAADGLIQAHTENRFSIVLKFFSAEEPGSQDAIEITELLRVLTSPVIANFSNNQADSITVNATIQTFYNPVVSIEDHVLAVAEQRGDIVTTLSEQLTAADTLTFTLIVKIAEELLAAGTVQTFYQAMVEVVAALTISGAVRSAYSTKVADELTIEDSDELTLTRVAAVLDTINAATTVQNVLTIAVEETASITAGDTIELSRHLLAELLDTVDIYTMFTTSDELAQGWVMNTEGSMPISEYDNFAFNSMAWFDGQLYAASDSGLYTHEGDTDAGEEIYAQLSTLMLDFGTSRQKRIRSAYIGYTASDALVLKVRAVSAGVLEEDWYLAKPVAAATAPRDGYYTVGQGLKSRYWQFELTNVDGADFEIDELELFPLILNRRI